MNQVQIDNWKIDMGQRLRDVIKGRFGPLAEHKFAKCINISQGSLSDILNGHNTPSAFTLFKIGDRTTIDIKYILMG